MYCRPSPSEVQGKQKKLGEILIMQCRPSPSGVQVRQSGLRTKKGISGLQNENPRSLLWT